MTPHYTDDWLTVYLGDCRAVLAELPAESVHCVVTSPPYWSLRDYGQPGQLGLEPTPDAYIEAMVGVFREVRRVLRRDGVAFVNMGDGFSGKQLQGIPWRLALALQQPYYTGKIRDEKDRIWLAAMVEAEGCLFLHRRRIGQSNGQGYVRKHDSYGAGLEVANTSRAIVERCMAIVGKGSISEQTPEQNTRRKQTIYRWNLRSNECREVIRELYPHFVAKQHQARLLLSPSSGPQAEKAHRSLIALHNGGTPDIDFPEPESMYEGGWFLRSDIVWSKCRPNPMPESVTDRPTKSHEYLFLLTRSARYYYDADAVREPNSNTSHGRTPTGIGPKHLQRTRSGDDTLGIATAGRNLRSVWTIATQPYPGSHFATFPEALVEPCVKAGTSERGVCPECGAPWVREVERQTEPARVGDWKATGQRHRNDIGRKGGFYPTSLDRGWHRSCTHEADPIPATVLDCFAGSGTTARVANRLSRRAILIDLSADYLDQAMLRNAQPPLGLGA